MKRIILLIIYFSICTRIFAQPLPDSVKNLFNAAKTNSEKGKILITYFDSKADDDSIFKNLITLKQYFVNTKQTVAEDYVRMGISRQLSRVGEYAEALNELFQLLPRFEQRRDEYGIMVCNRHLSYAYYAAGDKEKTLYYDKSTVELSRRIGDKYDLASAYNNIGADLSEYGFTDSSLLYSQNALKIAREINNPMLISKTLGTLGEFYLAQKRYDQSIPWLRESLSAAMTVSKIDVVYALNDFSVVYQAKHQTDSAIFYASLAAGLAKKIKITNQLLRAYQYLYSLYEDNGPLDSAYKYLRLIVNTKDSVYTSDKAKQVQAINIRELNRKQEIEQEETAFQNKIKLYSLLAVVAVFFIIGLILYRNNKEKKRTNLLLQDEKQKVETTLSELKSTQQQLIQSEKMASLGELTAGIAHEIQNPLNFVNNFSEVNKELVDELKQEADKGNIDEVKAIAKDIRDNEEKINHHGKRADAIVKGMLQHSRKNSGTKEPTDINALCDEYLRLSFHGMRAKDKNFNADFKTDFDESIGKINIVPQDIGRVLLNLFNNAFFAVNEKKKLMANNYQPIAEIKTRRINSNVEIIVCDNGNGIPQNIIDKVFQPFFTTKPTGQGTGLGLSLSYDIITKEHNGTIKAESKESEGTTFTIQLPLA